jgi:alpha-L-rhamnosidase
MKPSTLRCEYLTDPLSLDITSPRLSWKLEATNRRGVAQSAYQILVASSPELLAQEKSDLWDSGRVESDASTQVHYAGAALPSRARCYWKVRVWDEAQTASEWSDPARWEMGLLHPADWTAEWIAAPMAGGHRSSIPSPFLRKEFTLDRPVASARLYVTAHGLYEFSLNGKPVGGDVFTPGWTDYSKRIQYQAYDVTALLQPGANAAGAILGDGWYCGYVAWNHRQNYGERPALLAQLEIEFADGERTIITSEGSWKTAFGPILESDLLMGEVYDARCELPGWDTANFKDANWNNVLVLPDDGVRRVGMRGLPVRRQLEIKPIALLKTGGNPIFDLGQNLAGRVRLKITAPAGTTVRIKHAEVLDEKGELYTTNLRTATATDAYTCKGGGEEVWEPRFTFHGFRYVQVLGFVGEATLDTVIGIVLHSGMEATGDFECSDPLINQLQHNIQWGQRGNYLEVPTDCPQRDERLGWTGDAQVFIRTGAFNFNVAPFFTKWQGELADSQSATGSFPGVSPAIGFEDGGPAWADAGVICPWTVYLCYGDTALLSEHYGSLRRFIDSLKAAAITDIRSHPDWDGWAGFGDWLALDGGDTLGLTPKDLIGTAFFAYSTRLMSHIARLLGKPEDAEEYDALFEKVKAAYQRRFITADGLIVSGTQTACVLTLQFELAPESMRPQILKELVRSIEKNGNKLATGFVGTSYLPHVLTRGGRIDVAYTLLFQKNWPSWLYAVTQGATTIWERWNGWTKEKGFEDAGMNSFNHYAYGAIGEWLYSTVAGLDIDPAAPAYKHAIVKPQPGGGLTHASARLDTLYGELASGWEIQDDALTLNVTVPPNTTATVYVPAEQDAPVTEGGAEAAQAPGVEACGWENGAAVYRVGSGSYRFATRRSASV